MAYWLTQPSRSRLSGYVKEKRFCWPRSTAHSANAEPADRSRPRDMLPYEAVETKSLFSTGRQTMAHNYAINDDVHHQLQGPQGRATVKERSVYTIVSRLPIEAEGRPRYRTKSKTENV